MTQKVGPKRILDALCPYCRDGNLTQRGESRYYVCSFCDKKLQCKVCGAEKALKLYLKGWNKFCECAACHTRWFWDETPVSKTIEKAKAVRKALARLCEYCGGSDSYCPHCQSDPAGHFPLLRQESSRASVREAQSRKCPRCEDGRLIEHEGQRSCLLCQAVFPSSLYTKSDLAGQLKEAAEDEAKMVTVGPLINSRFWNTPCPLCKVKHKVVQYDTGQLHCFQCGHSWTPDQKMLQNDSTSHVIRVLGKSDSQPPPKSAHKVTCPACHTKQSLAEINPLVECKKKECGEYFPVDVALSPPSTEGMAISPEDYDRIEALLGFDEADVKAFKRFQERSDELASLLDDVLTYGHSLKEAMYHGQPTTEAFVNLDDAVEQLSEIQAQVIYGDEDDSDDERSNDLWSQREPDKWKQFDEEQKSLGELYNEVTIEDIDGDLADGEIVVSALPLPNRHNMDEEYEDNDDDRITHDMFPYIAGKCPRCGERDFDHAGCCWSCGAHNLMDQPCEVCDHGTIDADGQCMKCHVWISEPANID